MLDWLFGNNKKKKKKLTGSKKSSGTTSASKNTAPARKMSGVAQTMDLPEEMRYIDLKTIRKIMHSIVQTYKALGYNNKNDSDLSAKEWHSWQVGIMFKLYQSGDRLFIGKDDRNSMFPKSIVDGGEAAAERIVENLAQKYNMKVNLKANKDALSRDFSWTAREVSALIYLTTEE